MSERALDDELEAGLRELEDYVGTVDEDPEKQFDDSKKTQFQNAINSISGLTVKPGRVPVPIDEAQVLFVPWENKSTTEMIEQEKTYHSLTYYLGDALNDEIDTWLPKLENELKQQPGNKDLRELYISKRDMLLKLRDQIAQLKSSGQMSNDKYLEKLKKVLEVNEKLHHNLVSEKKDEQIITRVFRRMGILRAEIAKMDGSLTKNLSVANPSKLSIGATSDPPVRVSISEGLRAGPENDIRKADAESNMKGPSTTKKHSASPVANKRRQTDNFFDEVPSTKPSMQAPGRPSVQTPNPTPPQDKPDPGLTNSSLIVVYLSYKIDARKNIKSYLETNFAEKRLEDITKYTEEIKQLQNLREKAMIDASKLTNVKIDALFREIEEVDILGRSRKQMQEEARKIAELVSQESKNIKNQKIAEAYTSHYTKFFQKLNLAISTPFTPMPKIEREIIEVPCNDVNTQIKKGEMVIQLKKVEQSGDVNTFGVEVSFQYENLSFCKDFGYNNKLGVFNREMHFDLDKEKILKKFLKNSLTFSVRKKHLWSSEQVGKATVPLAKLDKNFAMPFEFEVSWKEKKLKFTGEVFVNKALDTPMKEVKVFEITKMYPAFVPTQRVDPSGRPVTDGRQSVAQQPTSTNRPSTPTPQSQAPGKQTAPQNKSPEKPPISTTAPAYKSQYKYPLMSAAERQKFKALLAKNKFDSSTADYELAAFCVSFLETLDDEVTKQKDAFASEGDSESRKFAGEVIVKASQYKTYIESSLDSGKMTLADYMSKLENFLKLDEAFLVTLGKLNFSQGIYYVTNRKNAIAEELKMLKEQAG